MREMTDYCIYAKPEQYKSVMTVFYDLEIFPMEDDPVDLQDYIENFDFSEKCNGLLKFLLWCNADSDMSGVESALKQIADYDTILNLPRLELDGAKDEA